MVKFLDGATESHWVDYQKLLSWYGFHEEHGLRNSSKVFPKKVFKVFKVFALRLRNEDVNQLKLTLFIGKLLVFS